jgi:hypothetical protein
MSTSGSTADGRCVGANVALGSEVVGRTVVWDVCFSRLRAQKQTDSYRPIQVEKRSDSRAPDKDVQPLFGGALKQTFGRRDRSTGLGGKCAYWEMAREGPESV